MISLSAYVSAGWSLNIMHNINATQSLLGFLMVIKSCLSAPNLDLRQPNNCNTRYSISLLKRELCYNVLPKRQPEATQSANVALDSIIRKHNQKRSLKHGSFFWVS